MTAVEHLTYASDGVVLPFLARPPVGGAQGDPEVLCVPVMPRRGGFLLALPVGSVPPNLLEQGQEAILGAMFGPSNHPVGASLGGGRGRCRNPSRLSFGRACGGLRGECGPVPGALRPAGAVRPGTLLCRGSEHFPGWGQARRTVPCLGAYHGGRAYSLLLGIRGRAGGRRTGAHCAGAGCPNPAQAEADHHPPARRAAGQHLSDAPHLEQPAASSFAKAGSP